MGFRYRATVLEALESHGVRPTAETPPELIHEFINDLYRYEVRALRDRMRTGQIPKEAYAGHVLALRQRYPILSLPVRYWTETE